MSLYSRSDSPYLWYQFRLRSRRYSGSTGTADRGKAREAEAAARAAAWRQVQLGEPARYPWATASKRWLTETRKRSIERDRQIIAWFDQHLSGASLQDITPDVIEQLRGLRAEQSSDATADRHMALLRAILRKANAQWRVLDSVPRVPMYRPEIGEPRWLTQDEFKRLHDLLPPALKRPAMFAVLTGLRMQSMLSLDWSQVDLARSICWIAGAEMKGKRTHGLPLSPQALSVLVETPESERSGPVFVWRGRRLASCYTSGFKRAVAAAGLAPLRWHDLRHTWASWAVQAGVSLQEVMQLGGWRSLAMVLRYSHLAPEHLAAAAARVRIAT